MMSSMSSSMISQLHLLAFDLVNVKTVATLAEGRRVEKPCAFP